MGKRRTKRKRQRAPHKQPVRTSAEPAVAGEDQERLVGRLVEVVAAGRGRRAVSLADQLTVGEKDSQAAAAIAAGFELRIRELFRDGHAEQARAMAARVADKTPDAVQYWPLGLQCRVGLATELPCPEDDEAIRGRLRGETWDPIELIDGPWEGTAREARGIIEAWDRLDAGDDEGCQVALRQIGRRSALIDWRLFLQAQCALRAGDPAGLEANRSRIDPASPARVMLDALAGGEEGRPFVELLQRHASTGFPAELDQQPIGGRTQQRCLKKVFSRLRQDGHPSLASKLLTCYMHLCNEDEGLDIDVTLADLFRPVDIAEALLRMSWPGEASASERDEAIDTLLRLSSWPPREQAFLLMLRCENARRRPGRGSGPFGFLRAMFEDFIDPGRVATWARKATGLWPELDAAYEHWDWAEQESEAGTCRALAAWRKARPERVDLVRRHIEARIEREDLKGIEKDIASLAATPGEGEQAAALNNRWQLARARRALTRGRFDDVDEIARGFESRDARERVIMATYHWIVSENRSEKARRGRALGQAGSPWLVAALALSLDQKLTFTQLPAGVKSALKEPPETSVPQLLEAFGEAPEAMARALDNQALYNRVEAVIRSVNDPALARDVLDYVVLAHHAGANESLDLAILAFGLTHILLRDSDPAWISIGLAARAALLRPLQLYPGGDAEHLRPAIVELFAAARTLAPSPAQARDSLEPYLARASIAWQDVVAEDLSAAAAEAIVARERSHHELYFWQRELTARVFGSKMMPVGPFSMPIDDDEEDWEDDEGWEQDETEANGVEPTPYSPSASGVTDVDLPAYPPTTHLEAEILFDKVIEIMDPAVRKTRLGELFDLLEASNLGGRSLESLKRMIVEARAEL